MLIKKLNLSVTKKSLIRRDTVGDLGAVTFFGLGQYWFNRFWFIQSWFIQSCLYQSCFGNQ